MCRIWFMFMHAWKASFIVTIVVIIIGGIIISILITKSFGVHQEAILH